MSATRRLQIRRRAHACKGKRAHSTLGAAEADIRALEKRFGGGISPDDGSGFTRGPVLKAYRCEFCLRYHTRRE